MSGIRFEHIDKIYDNGFQAAYDFNLEINDGEFVVFVGPSGCGKSTMMRIIAGLEEITRGTLYFDGKPVNNLSPNERGIAMVFQSYALYPHLNVYQNMAFALTLDGYDEDYIEKRVKETAAILGMSAYLDRKPRELSGGQCQRVAVGRAIIRRPKVFLMDEPLSNLDAKQRVTMRSEIIEIHRKAGATTIYVTHDQVEAMTMADRIVVMRDGVIQQVGTPHDLYFNPVNKFVAGFVGEPPMNFIPCTGINGKITLDDTDVSIDLSKVFPKALGGGEKRKLVFGFRPEAVDLQEGAKKGAALGLITEVSEMLGDSVNIYGAIGAHRVILRTVPENMVEPDADLKFSVPHESIYLFDAETGGVIRE